MDSKNQQVLYVLTERGDIIIVEMTNSKDIECRVRGRLPLP